MKISVALCTYNGKAYLAKQLESILQQTLPVHEIVITDDNSTDGTSAILTEYRSQFPDVIQFAINRPGLGTRKNFEKALSLCTGDIIFLSDQDDKWAPNKVEKMTEAFTAHPEWEAVFSDGTLIDDQDKPVGGTLFSAYHFQTELQNIWKKDAVGELLAGRNKVTGATLAIKYSFLQKCLPFELPGAIWHDAWLGIHAALRNSLGWVNEPLIYYRVHASQQVGVGNGTTMKGNLVDASLKSVLLNSLRWETSLLELSKILLNSYSRPELQQMKKDKEQLLRLLSLRLNLPHNAFRRVLTIGKNGRLYFKSFGNPLRSVVRDILKPV